MSISLVKGQKIDLTKGHAGLSKVVVGLGWDAIEQKKASLAAKSLLLIVMLQPYC